jgi:transposase
MPQPTLLDMPQQEQARMLAALRRTRYGYILALHVLLLCAAGRNPSEIDAFLFGSRSSAYRIVHTHRQGTLSLRVEQEGRLSMPVRTTVLMPWLKAASRTYGWCRTRWSGATLAATLEAKGGIRVSAETMRRWLHEMGWVWKWAKLVAKDNDLKRLECLARIRYHQEHLQAHEVMVFADELDIHLLPKVGATWMPKRKSARGHDAGQK